MTATAEPVAEAVEHAVLRLGESCRAADVRDGVRPARAPDGVGVNSRTPPAVAAGDTLGRQPAIGIRHGRIRITARSNLCQDESNLRTCEAGDRSFAVQCSNSRTERR